MVAIYLACIAIASSAMANHRAVQLAIGFDLTVTSSAAFWWFAVRPGHARPGALVRVVVVGFAIAKLVVGLPALGLVGIAAELAVLALLAVRIRRIARRTRAERRAGHGLTAALDLGMREAFPAAIAGGLAVELSAVVLALTGWFRRAPAGVTVHRRSGYLLVLGVLCFLAVVETVGLHVVLVQVAPTAAIVSTVLSVYGLVWLTGHAHAVRLSPLRVVAGTIVIERGLVARAAVPLADIVAITEVDGKRRDAIDLSILGPNVLLELRAPAEVCGLFGRTRRATRITLSADDVDALRALAKVG